MNSSLSDINPHDFRNCEPRDNCNPSPPLPLWKAQTEDRRFYVRAASYAAATVEARRRFPDGRVIGAA